MAQKNILHIQICDTNHVHVYTHINKTLEHTHTQKSQSVEFIKAEGQNHNSSARHLRLQQPHNRKSVADTL